MCFSQTQITKHSRRQKYSYCIRVYEQHQFPLTILNEKVSSILFLFRCCMSRRVWNIFKLLLHRVYEQHQFPLTILNEKVSSILFLFRCCMSRRVWNIFKLLLHKANSQNNLTDISCSSSSPRSTPLYTFGHLLF